MPTDAPVLSILAVLAHKMGFTPRPYRLVVEATGRSLSGEKTIRDAGVRDGAVLLLQAGRPGERVQVVLTDGNGTTKQRRALVPPAVGAD